MRVAFRYRSRLPAGFLARKNLPPLLVAEALGDQYQTAPIERAGGLQTARGLEALGRARAAGAMPRTSGIWDGVGKFRGGSRQHWEEERGRHGKEKSGQFHRRHTGTFDGDRKEFINVHGVNC